uniref:Protein KTI12 homolog n=1 Tax=Mesocestoides corti TaxID=53468 RepID=A0A5K3EII9_MESCO
MPLILFCGYPCSGKSLVAAKLAEALSARRPDCQVEVVSEEAIARANSPSPADQGDPRAQIFSDARLEKQLRSQIKSQADRILASKKGNSAVCVLVDANNYIKGYRYELHCVAKSTRHQQAIVYCTTPEMTCRANNSQLARYSDDLFTNLVSRFERPNPASRWDSPLYEICLPDLTLSPSPAEELQQLVEGLCDWTIHELLQSDVKITPNQSTIPVKAAAVDYLQTLEKATSRVIGLILTAQSQGDEQVSLPNHEYASLQLGGQEAWTPTTLAKAKRHFLAFVRSGFGAGVTKQTTEEQVCVLFIRFLANEGQKDALLA